MTRSSRSLLSWLLVSALALAVMGAPSSASANRPTKVGKKERQRAKELFQKGHKLFRDLNYKKALGLFQESFDLSGNPGLLIYIGLCFQKLGNYPKAIAYLEDFLKLAEGAPEKERTRAKGAIEDMRRRLEQEERSRETERKETEAKLDKTLQDEDQSTDTGGDKRPLWKDWKLWTGVGIVTVAAGATVAFFLLRDDGIPDSDFGNIPLGFRF